MKNLNFHQPFFSPTDCEKTIIIQCWQHNTSARFQEGAHGAQLEKNTGLYHAEHYMLQGPVTLATLKKQKEITLL